MMHYQQTGPILQQVNMCSMSPINFTRSALSVVLQSCVFQRRSGLTNRPT
jgi:hypothetical protein